MSELFEEDEDQVLEVGNDFEEVEIDTTEIEHPIPNLLDARRRLEQILEEKRLREELDDFLDEEED